MNHNLSLQRIRFETLEVCVNEKTRTLNISSIQERSTIGVKAYLLNAENVILTPHIAGWTIESKTLLAQVIVDKIKALDHSLSLPKDDNA